jgi:hypothetical protein
MDLWQHAVISAAGSGAWYWATGDPVAAAAFSATGIFVDLDHWPDYWRDRGARFHLQEFWDHFGRNRPPKLWLVGHGWEWVPALALLAWWSGARWLWGAAAGLLLHLILDQAVNGFRTFGYSILYRASVGWDSDRIFVAPRTDGKGEPFEHD